MALVCITEYITRSDNQPYEYEICFYYENYGTYTYSVDYGKTKRSF